MDPLVLINDVLMRKLSFLGLSSWLALDQGILFPQNLASVSIFKELIFLLEILDDFSVVDLFASFLLNLLMSHLLDLKHDLVEPMLINETESKFVALVEQEIDIDVA